MAKSNCKKHRGLPGAGLFDLNARLKAEYTAKSSRPAGQELFASALKRAAPKRDFLCGLPAPFSPFHFFSIVCRRAVSNRFTVSNFPL